MAGSGRSWRAPGRGRRSAEALRRVAMRGLLASMTVCALLLAGVMPAQAREPVAALRVFLAVGQSNMSGRGLPIGGPEDKVDPRIFQFGAKNRTLRPGRIHLDMHDSPSGISPATTFAREYLKAQPENVGVLIIPAAHGGTVFASAAGTLTWSVGKASAPEYDLPELAIAQTLEGIAAARAAGYAVSLEGILWHQGEGNARMSTAAYSAHLDELIGHFRSRLQAPALPFVVGGMTPEGIDAIPGRKNVDRSHRETPSRVVHTGFADAMRGGLNAGDITHFSRTGVEYLGKTYLSGYWRAAGNAGAGSTPAGYPGQTVAVPATRILDTRLSSGRVPGGGSVTFKVAGVNGLPVDIAAVAINLTVTEAASFGFITAHASGTGKPNASNVNYAAGQTVPNLAVVPVGADGKVILSNTSTGSVQLVADVSAYFRAGTPSVPGAFKSIAPTRFLDTRTSSGKVIGGRAVSFTVAGTRGVPANAAAVVLNLTATETKASGFLTAHATGTGRPNASNVNYGAGQTIPNLVVVPIGRSGKVTISNTSSGSAQVVADVSGYFLAGEPARAGSLDALAVPTRFLDTRVSSGRVPAGGSVALQVAGVNGLPATLSAVVVNLTVTEARSAGFLTAFASGAARPNASNVNFAPGQTVPNLAVVPVGPDGRIRIANSSGGSVQLVADVSGYIMK
ncbi:MAG: sialate O-acetylesterase [Arthrobacter oryzae]